MSIDLKKLGDSAYVEKNIYQPCEKRCGNNLRVIWQCRFVERENPSQKCIDAFSQCVRNCIDKKLKNGK